MTPFDFLAWLYWDPPKEVFTVPIIDRPVVWYGILFVTGFIIAYFIFAHILTKFIRNSRYFSALDVNSWPKLIQALQNPSKESSQILYSLWQKLKPDTKSAIQSLHSPFKPLDQTKDEIITGLNSLLNNTTIQRSEVEANIPGISSAKRLAFLFADRLIWFTVLGTLIGARLGQVFFYDWDMFSTHPMEIVKIWKGGLASHGGVIGVIIAIYLYFLSIKKWIPDLSFLKLLDFVAIPSALVACFIRLGNFMNQEIVGTPSTLPWAVVFGNAADGSLPIPRHPIQLYEALAYLITFTILYRLWKIKSDHLPSGTILGMLFIFIFGSRLILEFWKVQQSSVIDSSYLQMGQLLSIPFILLGLLLVFCPKKNGKSCQSK